MEELLELASKSSIFAQIGHSSLKVSCTCRSNHRAKLPRDSLEGLMISIRDVYIYHLKCYVLGKLATVVKEAALVPREGLGA